MADAYSEGATAAGHDVRRIEMARRPFAVTPDEFMKRLGRLPLAHQPGAGWLYHTSCEILGVLRSTQVSCSPAGGAALRVHTKKGKLRKEAAA